MLVLIADNVINDTNLSVGENVIEWILEEVLLETWEEDALVLFTINCSLNKGVDGVTVGANGGNDD